MVPRLVGWPLGQQLGAPPLLAEDAGRVRLAGVALVAVANVFAVFGAIGPYVVLNEPGKVGWKGGIELPAVNAVGQVLYHPHTPLFRVAARSIGMVELAAIQNSGPVQEVVNQAVDGNHVKPHLAVVPAGQEQAGQGHVSEFGANIGNCRDFSDEGVEKFIDCPSGQTASPKMLCGICVKVPPTDISQKKIQ